MFDVVRSAVPKMSLDEAFEAKDHVADSVAEQLGQVLCPPKNTHKHANERTISPRRLKILNLPIYVAALLITPAVCHSQTMADFGYEIIKALVIDLTPDQRVSRFFSCMSLAF